MPRDVRFEQLVLVALIAGSSSVAAASAADPKAVEAALIRWIGTATDGWTPVAFGALRSGMSPAEVGTSFPGAEKTLTSASSKIRISGIPYVQEVQFGFVTSRPDGQKGLHHAILTFERGVFDDKPRRDALVRVLEAKFGAMRAGSNALTKGSWRATVQGQRRMAQFVDWGRGQDLQLSFDFAPGPTPAAAASAATRKPAASPAVTSTSIFHSSSCRAAEVTEEQAIVEASAATLSACKAALQEKLRASRCTQGVESTSYRLQQWAVGRWSHGVRLTLRCR